MSVRIYARARNPTLKRQGGGWVVHDPAVVRFEADPAAARHARIQAEVDALRVVRFEAIPVQDGSAAG